MNAPESYAKVVVSWVEAPRTFLASVTLRVEGIELDEAVSALVAGLKATTDRGYVIEATEIAEYGKREPIEPDRPRPVPPRKVELGPPRTRTGGAAPAPGPAG